LSESGGFSSRVWGGLSWKVTKKQNGGGRGVKILGGARWARKGLDVQKGGVKKGRGERMILGVLALGPSDKNSI